jgi:hypothetical protein
MTHIASAFHSHLLLASLLPSRTLRLALGLVPYHQPFYGGDDRSGVYRPGRLARIHEGPWETGQQGRLGLVCRFREDDRSGLCELRRGW